MSYKNGNPSANGIDEALELHAVWAREYEYLLKTDPKAEPPTFGRICLDGEVGIRMTFPETWTCSIPIQAHPLFEINAYG